MTLPGNLLQGSGSFSGSRIDDDGKGSQQHHNQGIFHRNPASNCCGLCADRACSDSTCDPNRPMEPGSAPERTDHCLRSVVGVSLEREPWNIPCFSACVSAAASNADRGVITGHLDTPELVERSCLSTMHRVLKSCSAARFRPTIADLHQGQMNGWL